jgi:hypothetical protein
MITYFAVGYKNHVALQFGYAVASASYIIDGYFDLLVFFHW